MKLSEYWRPPQRRKRLESIIERMEAQANRRRGEASVARRPESTSSRALEVALALIKSAAGPSII